MGNIICLGTRSSELAIAQAREVVRRLKSVYSEQKYKIVTRKTAGDKQKDRQPTKKRDRGFFVKGIEEALLAEEIDFAVHSLKDLPRLRENDLDVAAIPPREDPRDVLITRQNTDLSQLPAGARLATGSMRRKCELLAMREDLEVVPVRGNVPTRLAKLRENNFEGLILAAAGLARLGKLDVIDEYFSPEQMIPSAGQGALALQIRTADDEMRKHLQPINETRDEYCVRQEKKFINHLSLGCRQPVGAFGKIKGEEFQMATIYYPDGPGSSIRLSKKKDLNYEENPALELARETLRRCE